MARKQGTGATNEQRIYPQVQHCSRISEIFRDQSSYPTVFFVASPGGLDGDSEKRFGKGSD